MKEPRREARAEKGDSADRGAAAWLAIKRGDWLSFRDAGNFVAGGSGGMDYLVGARRKI